MHNTSSIYILTEIQSLDSVITQEHLIGAKTFPPIDHPYFQMPTTTLLSKHTTYKIDGF